MRCAISDFKSKQEQGHLWIEQFVRHCLCLTGKNYSGMSPDQCILNIEQFKQNISPPQIL